MKILVIGKPTYNMILPVSNFLVEGSKVNIAQKLEMGGGASFYTAALLGKWKANVSYTGVIGSDIYGNKIKSDLEEFGVNVKFIEINYEHPTSFNYVIINESTGSSTQIIKDNPEINLTKYKYDFVPDYIIMDGTDMNGSIAALNNFPKATSILFANKVSEALYNLSKRCNYVVANMTYAKALAKLEIEINKPKALVSFMQKIKDLNKANYIIMLRDHGVLYVSDSQVKMIPTITIEKKVDDTNGGYVFFGAFCYAMAKGYGIDNAAKVANIAAGLALTKMGTNDSLPELADVLSIAGLKEVSEKSENAEETEPTTEDAAETSKEEVQTPETENSQTEAKQ